MSLKFIYRIVLMLVIITLSLGVVLATVPASSPGLFIPLVYRNWPTISSQITSPVITEVLYNPVGKEPDGEWFEIYNPFDYSLQLNGYKIGDAEIVGDHEGMYMFPPGAVISPGGVIVIAKNAVSFKSIHNLNPDFELSDSDPEVPDLEKYDTWANGSTILGNLGDEIILINSFDEIADSVSWGSSTFAFDPSVPGVQDGHSIERWPASWDHDNAGDWIDQPQPQPGWVDITTPTPEPTLTFTPTPESTLTFTPTLTPEKTSIPCGSANLLISEVLYDPDQVADPDGEWFEIFNAGDGYVDLSCVRIGDEETFAGGEGMSGFPETALLAPGGVLIIANRAVDFGAKYGFYPDFELNPTVLAIPDMFRDPEYANGSVDLNNDGDDLLILDNAYNLIDTVSWGNSDFAFSPSVGKVSEGSSIERKPVYIDTDTAMDWSERENPDPGDVDYLLPTPVTQLPTITPFLTPTFTLIPTSVSTPDATPEAKWILISEVMYNPRSQEPDGEWIEIWNIGIVTADLSNFKLGDEETYGGIEGMHWFPAGSTIEPGQVIIVSNKATNFNLTHGFLPDYEINNSHLGVPDMIPYVDWSGGEFRLDNTGDQIFLLDIDDNIVDIVAFGQSEYLGFYPPVVSVAEGHSIERYPADIDTDTISDWIDQVNPNPGLVSSSSLLP
jgi:hypothetical protein